MSTHNMFLWKNRKNILPGHSLLSEVMFITCEMEQYIKIFYLLVYIGSVIFPVFYQTRLQI